MQEKSFWNTKEGILTIAFIIIMIAFFIILTGLSSGSDAVCLAGFVIMAAALLFSPVNTFILSKFRK